MPTDLAHDTGLPGLSGPGKDLHTGVWHGDRVFDLPVPVDWQVTALWPSTPPALSDRQIANCMERPAGRDAIARTCAGRHRPLVIVDSTVQPTPVGRLLPHILAQLRQGGIEPAAVRILVATGDGGFPRPESLIKKLGPAAADCELLIHDPHREGATLGTLGGTVGRGVRLIVNRQVLASDFVIGVEGIYPVRGHSYPAGSSLILSVLGAETIEGLSARFSGRGPAGSESEFQDVLDSIADRLHLDMMISAQVDAQRNLVRLGCGDPKAYYPREIAFAGATFRAPPPDDADIVVANAYPADLSLAAALGHALDPLSQAASGASRILLASCAEGAGLMPAGRSWWSAVKDLAGSGRRRLRGWPRATRPSPAGANHRNRIWLYRPGPYTETIPAKTGEVRLASSWEHLVAAVSREQAHKRFCRVYLYPCAPLQLLRPPATPISMIP